MLFVPAHLNKFIAGAHTRHADAYVLDLEDGVPLASKEAARRQIVASAKAVAQSGAAALVRINSAVDTPRRMGMILGSEDFAASVGMEPIAEALFLPNQQVLFACVRAGILPLGFPASIADYSDIDTFRGHIRLARKLGFVGAFCVHPSQVQVLNDEFLPPTAELDLARELLAAYEQAQIQGRSAFEHRGRMIDPPVIARARRLLRRIDRFSRQIGIQ
jgi:citrate lyase subunit beta / citryl-CoA lyase